MKEPELTGQELLRGCGDWKHKGVTGKTVGSEGVDLKGQVVYRKAFIEMHPADLQKYWTEIKESSHGNK